MKPVPKPNATSIDPMLFEILDKLKEADINGKEGKPDGIIDLGDAEERKKALEILHASKHYYSEKYGPAAIVLNFLDSMDAPVYNRPRSLFTVSKATSKRKEDLDNKINLSEVRKNLPLIEGEYMVLQADIIEFREKLIDDYFEVDQKIQAGEVPYSEKDYFMYSFVLTSSYSLSAFFEIFKNGAYKDIQRNLSKNLPEIPFKDLSEKARLGIRRAFGLSQPMPGSSFDRIQNWPKKTK